MEEWYQNIPSDFVPENFKLAEIKKIGSIIEKKLHFFQRKIEKAEEIEDTDENHTCSLLSYGVEVIADHLTQCLSNKFQKLGGLKKKILPPFFLFHLIFFISPNFFYFQHRR